MKMDPRLFWPEGADALHSKKRKVEKNGMLRPSLAEAGWIRGTGVFGHSNTFSLHFFFARQGKSDLNCTSNCSHQTTLRFTFIVSNSPP